VLAYAEDAPASATIITNKASTAAAQVLSRRRPDGRLVPLRNSTPVHEARECCPKPTYSYFARKKEK
jgi:hypothetical protein